MSAPDPEIEVKGPVIDDETEARMYTARLEGRETTFSLIPVGSGDGDERWVMHVGTDVAVPTDPGFEAFDSPESAFDAGVRASKEQLLG
jgi:hypothetical protein